MGLTQHLLKMPGLLAVVRTWDREVRQACGINGLWLAHVSPETGEFTSRVNDAGIQRHTRARKDLKEWQKKVGLPYHSPHKFRHGHAVYSLTKCKDMADLKAVSMNLMHSKISITDGVYANLSNQDIAKQIASLSNQTSEGELSKEYIARMLIELAEKIKKSHQV